jgi:hypothetical protein
MTTPLAQLVAVAKQHAEAEAQGDLDAILATMEGEPVYELYPLGKKFSGMEKTLRYYKHFVATAQKQIAGFEMHGEWVANGGVAQEYTVMLHNPGGAPTAHRIFAILTFGKEKLSGERMYADETLLRTLVGPLWDELETIST